MKMNKDYSLIVSAFIAVSFLTSFRLHHGAGTSADDIQLILLHDWTGSDALGYDKRENQI